MSNTILQIADLLLRIQENIGNIIKNYSKASLQESLLAIRYNKALCDKMLETVNNTSVQDSIGTAICQQYVSIIGNNMRLLTDLENNCIHNQKNIETASKLKMLNTMQNTVKKLKGGKT